jgi:uncharacterized protein (TIGR03435 family)
LRTLVETLGRQLNRPVIDRTGLTGVFDFNLEWAPDSKPREAAGPATSAEAGTSLFTALQEQLGLKLEAGKSPIEILVVDHAERVPVGN